MDNESQITDKMYTTRVLHAENYIYLLNISPAECESGWQIPSHTIAREGKDAPNFIREFFSALKEVPSILNFVFDYQVSSLE